MPRVPAKQSCMSMYLYDTDHPIMFTLLMLLKSLTRIHFEVITLLYHHHHHHHHPLYLDLLLELLAFKYIFSGCFVYDHKVFEH